MNKTSFKVLVSHVVSCSVSELVHGTSHVPGPESVCPGGILVGTISGIASFHTDVEELSLIESLITGIFHQFVSKLSS